MKKKEKFERVNMKERLVHFVFWRRSSNPVAENLDMFKEATYSNFQWVDCIIWKVLNKQEKEKESKEDFCGDDIHPT